MTSSWEHLAEAWTRWARDPQLDDDFWSWHLDAFLELLPAPAQLTVDVACGEGRLPRELASHGHQVLGVDASPSLVRSATESGTQAVVADATALPLQAGSTDLVVHFCCLQDLDDLTGAVTEAARVLRPQGLLCQALPHPVRTARGVDRYADEAPYVMEVERRGESFTYHGMHRPVGAYLAALLQAGLRIDAVREVFDPRGGATGFLHLRAVHP
jgi:SAM-dependent methyltransferase